MRKCVCMLLCAGLVMAAAGCGGGGGTAPAPIPAEEEQPLSIQELLELGERYLVELNYEEAIVAYNQVLEIEPKNLQAWEGLATAYVQTADYGNAAQAYTNIAEQRPDDADVQFMRGITSYLSDDNDTGENAITEGLGLVADENGAVSQEDFDRLLEDFAELGINVLQDEEADYYHTYVLELPDGRHILITRYNDGTFSVETLDAGEEVPAQFIPDALVYFNWKNLDPELSAYFDYADFSEDGTVTLYGGNGQSDTLPYYFSGGDGFYPEGTIYIGSPDFMSPDAYYACFYEEVEGVKGMGISGIHFGEYYFLQPVRP